jgi:hypothetical protein
MCGDVHARVCITQGSKYVSPTHDRLRRCGDFVVKDWRLSLHRNQVMCKTAGEGWESSRGGKLCIVGLKAAKTLQIEVAEQLKAFVWLMQCEACRKGQGWRVHRGDGLTGKKTTGKVANEVHHALKLLSLLEYRKIEEEEYEGVTRGWKPLVKPAGKTND